MMHLKEFLVLLYGRWYQTADQYFDLDPYELDPAGERFAPWGLREFIRQFGSSDWLTDELVVALLRLRRNDFLQLLSQDQIHLEEVLAWAVLQALVGEEEERLLPEDVLGEGMLAVPEHRAYFTYYPFPSYLAVMLTAYRGCQMLRRDDWFDFQRDVLPVERLWAAALRRGGLEEARYSLQEVSLPSHPLYPALEGMLEADVLLVWQGWEVGLPGCSLKLIDTVLEVLERLVAVTPFRPAEPLEYKGNAYGYSSLYSWLQAGGPDRWRYDY